MIIGPLPYSVSTPEKTILNKTYIQLFWYIHDLPI